jgi:hypothetical protein
MAIKNRNKGREISYDVTIRYAACSSVVAAQKVGDILSILRASSARKG